MTPPDDPAATLARYREGPSLLADTVAGVREAEFDAPPADGAVVRLSVGDAVGMQADHLEQHVRRIEAVHRELGRA